MVKEWIGEKSNKNNLSALSGNAQIPAGLIGALFGRMVTSDPKANIDAPIHVAHAFTVHEDESETDYFIATDDLAFEDESGADTIQDTELTSNLFYGYVVVDIPELIKNLGDNLDLAGNVLHNLLYLIAEVSPGAKLGSTAPYSRASFLLIESGNRQPRSLAEAYRKPCSPNLDSAVNALTNHLESLDKNYATGEERYVMTLAESNDLPNVKIKTLGELAEVVKELPHSLS